MYVCLEDSITISDVNLTIQRNNTLYRPSEETSIHIITRNP